MKIHVLSDLHIEFHQYTPADVDADVVILAGDIGLGTRGVEWAKSAFSCPVIYVPGNHEYYRGNLNTTREQMLAAGTDRVHVLDFGEIIIGGVRFLGATGWTDYAAKGNAPLAAVKAQQYMSDFDEIRTGPSHRQVFPDDFASISKKTKKWLHIRLQEPFDGPTVVVTHHAPSVTSLFGHPQAGTLLDAAFANNWEDLMGDGLTLWVHGHSHAVADFHVGSTRVLSNPRGYPREPTGFDPSLVVEL